MKPLDEVYKTKQKEFFPYIKTVKQIGKLFGSINKSRVSRVLAKC